MLAGEALTRAREQYDARKKTIQRETETCRYCKSARTRTKNPVTICKNHADEYRLAYVCSPISETYWAT